MSASVPSTFPALDNTMGAWLIGTFCGILLQGLAFHQTYRYYRLYPRDPIYIKIWVFVLLLAETVNTALIMHTSYFYLVSNYFRPTVLLAGPVWSLKILPVPASLTAVITQTFFARRIFLINRKFRPIAVISIILIIAFCGSFVAFTALGWNEPTLASFLKFSWLASLASGLIMAADLIMTVTLIIFLHRNHTGVIRTDSILDFLLVYAVSTGLLICIFNVLNVTFSIIWPDNLIYTAISIILTKLYSNTFLVSLNARESLLLERGNIHTSPFKSSILKPTQRSSTVVDHRVAVPEMPYEHAKKHHSSKDIELMVVTHVECDADSSCDLDTPVNDIEAV